MYHSSTTFLKIFCPYAFIEYIFIKGTFCHCFPDSVRYRLVRFVYCTRMKSEKFCCETFRSSFFYGGGQLSNCVYITPR